jgi:Glycine cleavage system protein P (pyridoxal-binding), N-terminal domain
MEHPWIPNSNPKTKAEMLKVIGVSSPEELFADIPKQVIISEERWNSLPIGAGRPLSEVEVSKRLDELFNDVKPLKAPPFAAAAWGPTTSPLPSEA